MDKEKREKNSEADSGKEISQSSESAESEDLKKSLNTIKNFVKKRYPLIILAFLIVFGFYLRYYHADYPVVGYHNWKETHYLTEARNYADKGFFYEGFLTPHWDYPYPNNPASGIHGDTFPTTSIITGIFFKIFGPSLLVARAISILFVLGGIIFAYLVIKKLFHDEYLALTAAALLTFNPLLVFFGRQADLINPGFFFGLFGLYFYLLWIEKPSYKNLLLFSAGITICVITKYPNALIGIPMAAIFPYSRIFKKESLKKFWRHFAVFIAIFSTIFIWKWYTGYYSAKFGALNVGASEKLIEISTLFQADFWAAMSRFAADNYTLLGVLLAFLGAAVFIFVYFKKIKSRKEIEVTFFASYILGAVVWFAVMSFKLKGHSYHQYPLVFLYGFLAAFFIVFLAKNIAKLLASLLKSINLSPKSFDVSALLIVLLLIGGLLFFANYSSDSWKRQFDTQFIGLDIAGNFIRSHSSPDEAVFHPSHQSYGVLWHADRKGYALSPNLTYVKETEKERNVQWVFLYQWGLNYIQQRDMWEYFQKNYSIAQIAFTQNPQNPTTVMSVYLLLKKGGSFNESDIPKISAAGDTKFRDYEYTFGKQRMFYVNALK